MLRLRSGWLVSAGRCEPPPDESSRMTTKTVTDIGMKSIAVPRCWASRWQLATALGLLLACPSLAVAQAGMSAADAVGSILGREKKPEALAAGPSISATDELVSDIRIEGARAVPTERVLAQLKTRIGRPYDPQLVQRDVKQLFALPWFVNVETYTDRDANGLVVIFKVMERPTIRYIEYLNNTRINDKKLAKETGLVTGGALSPYQVEEGRSRIEQLYKDNGFNRVQVQIVEGTRPDDRGVVYAINEGEQQRIWSVQFEGNQFATDGQLKTKVKSKPSFGRVVFKSNFSEQILEADVTKLTDYYRRFGFFQATVGRIVEWNDDRSWATIRFVISEGPQSSVRNVTFIGNQLFASQDLGAGLKLQDSQTFERDKLTGDVEWLKELYGSRGYVFADIKADVRYLDEPGQVDLVYSINEGKQFRVGRVFVHIGGQNPHTKIDTALNRLSIKPGQIMDIREIRASERRLMASSLFHTDAARNIYPKISFRIPEVDDAELTASNAPVTRGQNPDDAMPVAGEPGTYVVERPQLPTSAGEAMDVHLYFDPHTKPVAQPETPSQAQAQYTSGPYRHAVYKPALDQQVANRTETNSAYEHLDIRSANPYQPKLAKQPNRDSIYRGQSSGTQQVGWTAGSTPTPRSAASLPGGNVAATAWPQQAGIGGQVVQATGPATAPPASGGVQPVQFVDQIPPPGLPQQLPPNQAILPYPAAEQIVPGAGGLPTYTQPAVDVFVDLEETQTGRFLLGVGVNSDAGVVGQILLDERNFDWRRPPRSWQDVVDGTAWRGGGQKLRLEAAPGSEVQRYLATWQEPFLMGTPVSLSLSGSYYDRRFNDWDEQRLGGRIGLGYQWVQSDVSTAFSYRGESVNISNPSNPAEPQLAEVLGDNVLHGFRLGVINDTRDSAFLPTQGHYLEVYGEQVVGTFDYPRVGFDFKKYYLVRERADHSGRHVVSLTTKVDYTGTNTPVYDQFFAGGFSTMRGFDFRGASPVSNGVQVGGEFRWLNSAEYMFPITADDMLHGVVFCDFGTVEPGVEINDFRVAPGVGLRVTVPAMGPAPIALDFAFPVASAQFDDEQVFSFSIGFLR